MHDVVLADGQRHLNEHGTCECWGKCCVGRSEDGGLLCLCKDCDHGHITD